MVRCRVIEQFTLKDFDKLLNIKRKSIEEKGKLFVGDEFECDEQMAKYLTGSNEKKKVVVKVIEVMPKIVGTIEYTNEPIELKVEFKPTKKKKTSKK
ncbi:MAG: hypothetical protein IKV94_02680 [Clostridia bacterium]|nr:hypothetical protein [Clostridia bacterium]MBR6517079.1 hypothetical protein [Bacilli bacterium]